MYIDKLEIIILSNQDLSIQNSITESKHLHNSPKI